MNDHDSIRPVRWLDDGGVQLLDQRRLPHRVEYVDCRSAEEVTTAIRDMVVRGAPAIGIAAAYGAVLAAAAPDPAAALARLAGARPTAVNLRWALSRMARVSPRDRDALLNEARRIHTEDVAANRRMGELGSALIERGRAVLTHCNTGSLATGGYGTALGVIRRAWSDRRLTRVYAGETRPWLQGARLTAWELIEDGIPATVLADGAAAALLRTGEVGWVVVGADRVVANGDVANKIGTYSLALAARAHGVGFMVVAPTSTLDPAVASGEGIPLEWRGDDEVLGMAGRRIAPPAASAWNPVFDVTPAGLVDVLVTEAGVVKRPDTDSLADLMAGHGASGGEMC